MELYIATDLCSAWEFPSIGDNCVFSLELCLTLKNIKYLLTVLRRHWLCRNIDKIITNYTSIGRRIFLTFVLRQMSPQALFNGLPCECIALSTLISSVCHIVLPTLAHYFLKCQSTLFLCSSTEGDSFLVGKWKWRIIMLHCFLSDFTRFGTLKTDWKKQNRLHIQARVISAFTILGQQRSGSFTLLRQPSF